MSELSAKRGSALGTASIVSAALAVVVSLIGWVFFFVGFSEGAGSGGYPEPPLLAGLAGWVALGAASLLLVLLGATLGVVGLLRSSKDPSLSGRGSAWGVGLNLIGVPLSWAVVWGLFVLAVSVLVG